MPASRPFAPLSSLTPALLLVLILAPVSASAGDLEVTPSVSLREIYSDNIELSDTQPVDDWVTEISPAVNVRGHSDQLDFNLYGAVQMLYYLGAEANNGDHTEINPSLALRSTTTGVKNLLFLDLNASAGQRLVSDDAKHTYDNINISGDRSDYFTYTVAPYIENETRSGIYTTLRAEYGANNYDSEGNREDALNDTETSLYRGRIDNQQMATRFHWTIGASDRYVDYASDSQSDSNYREGQLDLSYDFSSHFSLIGRAGATENDLSGYDSQYNGDYSAAGLRWTPNRRFWLSAMSGNDYEDAEFNWKPSRRTDINVGYRDSSVGLVRGPSWRADMKFKGRRFGSTFRYSEEVTTEQLLMQDGDVLIPIFDDEGNIVTDPISGLPLFTIEPFYAIVDDDFQRNRAVLTFFWRSRGGNITLTLADEERLYLERTFLDSEGEDVVLAIDWPLTGSYHLKAQYRDLHTRYTQTGLLEDFLLYSFGIRNEFSERSYASLSLQHADRVSQRDLQSYEEARITAEFVLQF